MRRRAIDVLALGIVFVLASGCTSAPAATDDGAATDSRGTAVGEISVSGDLTAGTAAEGAGDEADVTGTAGATAATATTTAAVGAPTPTTRAPSTTSADTRPPTTEAEVIGDGPVLGDVDPAETPAIGGGLVPVFFVLDATTSVGCSDANPGTVRLTWEVIGTESVDLAIGTAGTVVAADQPPAGSLDVPLDCTSGSQYFVVASNPEGEAIRSVSVGAL